MRQARNTKFSLGIACALLLACASKSYGNQQRLQPERGANQVNSAISESMPRAPVQLANESESYSQTASPPDEDDLRYFPLSKYMKYPEKVRALIRRADMENDRCRGRFEGSKTLRACDRRDKIMKDLEHRGWCWGGSDVGYLEHWLKCAEDRYR
jgi:hypothetical protein